LAYLPPFLEVVYQIYYICTVYIEDGLVPRDGILFIPFSEIQKVITNPTKYKQNTIDIYINFKDETIELTYSTNTIDVTSFRLLK